MVLGFLPVGALFSRSKHQGYQRETCTRNNPRCLLPDPNEGPLRYMPKVSPDDPIVSSVAALSSGGIVTDMELLDTRWNGNEAFRIDLADGKRIFAKLNRVEDPSVFMSEALSLTAMLNASDKVAVPRPLHIGRLPRVGEYGPGAFMLLEWYDLAPFGGQRKDVQKALGVMLAALHTADCSKVHEQRFGFPSSNYLALTPMDNEWVRSWPVFFARRLAKQVTSAFKDKPYARAPLSQDEDGELKVVMQRIIRGMDVYFEGCHVTPSLLHGDLWIGNVGATKEGTPVIFDPASFYGHSEFDLALPRIFGNYTAEFWNAYFERVPKQQGYENRARLYELYQYFNQLNLFGDPEVKKKVLSLAHELASLLPVPS